MKWTLGYFVVTMLLVDDIANQQWSCSLFGLVGGSLLPYFCVTKPVLSTRAQSSMSLLQGRSTTYLV